ncbi:DUF6114 domain-containing protein [Nonomuraea rubra]|uniref:Uncharacterized protein n=1 Tax=Nonomuraea rubra TaxID=46180 RepID=A0A7X0NP30_9ACTN|nr:DUF6114 domain-containing protein [Nonomuraea rubra]MBB6547002.1 hypothetical protein [Nonomuraea rubra]
MKSWRRSRPFWGGLFIVVAGLELLSIPLALDALPVAVVFGAVGASYLIALVMVIAGVLVWLQPGQRVFLGLIAVLLSLASFVYSNLGGFLLGMILGLLGGMLAVAWTPDSRAGDGFDIVNVRGAVIDARACMSRVSGRGWAALAALAHRCRRSSSRRNQGRAEIGPSSVDTGRVAKQREAAG